MSDAKIAEEIAVDRVDHARSMISRAWGHTLKWEREPGGNAGRFGSVPLADVGALRIEAG